MRIEYNGPPEVPIPSIIADFLVGDYPTGFDDLYLAVCAAEGCGYESRPFETEDLMDVHMDWHWETKHMDS